MANETDPIFDDADGTFGETLNTAPETSLQGLADIRQVQSMIAVLYQHELQRLTGQGLDHETRRQRLEGQLRNSWQLVRSLKEASEKSGIRPEEAPAEGGRLHGRVTDKAKRGRQGLTVYGENENGNPLRAFGSAISDARGYFAILLSADTIEKYKKQAVYLAVGGKMGKALHRQPQPLTLEAGMDLVVNIVLDIPLFSKNT
ncbi:MAG: hypothetical protein BWK76_10845 [Desulfobulbaceae bacterium A2]|nr:MAG: hypothetical protein BWK76_10845 [Desulfobulbaceae bacterium A2]